MASRPISPAQAKGQVNISAKSQARVILIYRAIARKRAATPRGHPHRLDRSHLIQRPDESVTQRKGMVRNAASMSDVMSIAIAGLKASTARFAASANRVVEQQDVDLAAELVQQKLAAIDFKANVTVLRTADKMTKAALDIFA
jgi:flagellar basal body rod protein FlgC